MMIKNVILKGAVFSGLMMLSACTSPTPANGYMYEGINFGADRDDSFKKGVRDACKTANGYYTKDHALFNANESYRIGWEDGRLKCKGA